MGSVEFHDFRMVCLLEVVTAGWVANTLLFLLAPTTFYYDLSEILHAKVKCLISAGLVRPALPCLNKRFSSRNRLNNVLIMCFTYGD